MRTGIEELEIKGQLVKVNAMYYNNTIIIQMGKYIRTASLRYDWDEDVDDPETIVELIRKSPLHTDIFIFSQRLPDMTPRYSYDMKLYNVAAIPITSYANWWEKEITQETRNKIRKSRKKGIELKEVNYDTTFIKGIMQIYNETPVRQGKPFWHYGKDFETIKKIHESFLDRSVFIGAYLKDELVGFVKLVFTDKFVRTMHILSKVEHRDKSPTNALLSKCVEVCCSSKVPYLVYGQYDYGKTGTKSLTIFKRDNGFKKFELPQYYVPLTVKGKVFHKLNLHDGLTGVLPESVVSNLLKLRKLYYEKYGSRKP